MCRVTIRVCLYIKCVNVYRGLFACNGYVNSMFLISMLEVLACFASSMFVILACFDKKIKRGAKFRLCLWPEKSSMLSNMLEFFRRGLSLDFTPNHANNRKHANQNMLNTKHASHLTC